jgi:hypothetical protein
MSIRPSLTADDRIMDLKSPPMNRLVTTVKGLKKTYYLMFRSGASFIADLMLYRHGSLCLLINLSSGISSSTQLMAVIGLLKSEVVISAAAGVMFISPVLSQQLRL